MLEQERNLGGLDLVQHRPTEAHVGAALAVAQAAHRLDLEARQLAHRREDLLRAAPGTVFVDAHLGDRAGLRSRGQGQHEHGGLLRSPQPDPVAFLNLLRQGGSERAAQAEALAGHPQAPDTAALALDRGDFPLEGEQLHGHQ